MIRKLFLAGLLAAGAAQAQTPVADLHALFDKTWARDMVDDPLAATFAGDHRYDDRLPDLSPESRRARDAADAATLAALHAIPVERLDAQE